MKDLPMANQLIEDCWNRIGIRGNKSCDKLQEHVHCRNCDIYASAASAIMQRAIPPEFRREWTRRYAEEKVEKQTQEEAVMVFRIGAEWLALPMRLALSVAALSPVHCVPHRPAKALLGVVNVRGMLYPCMSLAALLNMTDSAPGNAGPQRLSRTFPRLLVMTLGRQTYALPVQEIRGIHCYASGELEPPPTTGDAATRTYVRGVLNHDGIRIGCLDPIRLGDSFAEMLK